MTKLMSASTNSDSDSSDSAELRAALHSQHDALGILEQAITREADGVGDRGENSTPNGCEVAVARHPN